MADLAEAAQEFADLAKNLTLVGETELRAELFKAIDEAAQPIEGDIRKAMPDFLPDRYAEVLDEDLAIRTSRRTGANTAGVRIIGTNRGRGGVQRRRVNRLNSGVLAHPLFGNRKRWYYQGAGKGVTPGFFTTPAEKDAPVVLGKILEAMRRVEDKALGR